MADKTLTLSAEGAQQLEKSEARVDGLYDDSSHYATYGVGHLVHKGSHKWKSLLLDAAQSDERFKSNVRTVVHGSRRHRRHASQTVYLDRGVLLNKDYEELKSSAKERALGTVAQALYKRPYADLSKHQQARVKNTADAAVDREVTILNESADQVLDHDVKPFEKAVNQSVSGPQLSQEEFDAAVSFSFNTGHFHGTTLSRVINQNKYRTGSVEQREKAIAEVERGFLMWNRSGGQAVAGLTHRRQEESDRFLRQARAELAELKRSATTKPTREIELPKANTARTTKEFTPPTREFRLP